MAGDEAYTLSDLAAEISRQTGKNISYENFSEAEYANALVNVGLAQGLAQAFAEYDVSASKGDLFDDSHQLSELIGRPTTPISRAVAEVLQESGTN